MLYIIYRGVLYCPTQYTVYCHCTSRNQKSLLLLTHSVLVFILAVVLLVLLHGGGWGSDAEDDAPAMAGGSGRTGCLPTRLLVTAAAAGAWAANAEPANVPRAEATIILVEPGERPSDSAIACACPLAAVSSSSVTGAGVAPGSSRFARFAGRDPSATTRTRGAAARALAVLTPALRRAPVRPFSAPVRPVFTISVGSTTTTRGEAPASSRARDEDVLSETRNCRKPN